MRNKVRIEQLEFRVDMLLAVVNELVLKEKGVALVWYDEYKKMVEEAGGEIEGHA